MIMINDVYDFYDLECEYDGRKSFYGKAKVIEMNNGDKILFSYDTKVCTVKSGKYYLEDSFFMSATTTRHIREFLIQNGFSSMSKSEILKNDSAA